MVKDLHEIIEGLRALFQFAKERTPTVEDRVAESIFTSILNNRYDYSKNSMVVDEKDVKTLAHRCKQVAKIYANANIDDTDDKL